VIDGQLSGDGDADTGAGACDESYSSPESIHLEALFGNGD
jgi:hypothetical protein